MLSEPTQQSALTAIERFVVENEDLLELEERIGKFNLFDVLKLSRVEIRHSNFLAWLLDPSESHGQGDLFLNAILMDMLSMASPEVRPFSPIELDGVDLHAVDVRREWNHIDILIISKHPAFAVIIENKIDSGEHDSQLDRYAEIVATRFPTIRRLCVFLTIDGDAPTNDRYIAYTYGDFHRVLSRCRKTFANSIGSDLLMVLDHYLRLIKSRFMEDQEITELCRRIYKNHRQALELIFENAGSPAAGMLNDIAELVEANPFWTVVSRRTSQVDFVPAEWAACFPPVGKRKTFNPRCWVVLKIRVSDSRCTSGASLWPTTDSLLRSSVLNRLTQQHEEFGFKLFSKKIVGDKFTQIGGRYVIEEWGDEEPDAPKILESVAKRLSTLEQQLKGVAGALAPIFAAVATNHEPGQH